MHDWKICFIRKNGEPHTRHMKGLSEQEANDKFIKDAIEDEIILAALFKEIDTDTGPGWQLANTHCLHQ